MTFISQRKRQKKTQTDTQTDGYKQTSKPNGIYPAVGSKNNTLGKEENGTNELIDTKGDAGKNDSDAAHPLNTPKKN